jgi:MobA/MobL family protein
MALVNFRVNHLKVHQDRSASRVVQYLTRAGRYAPTQAQVAYLTRRSAATAERDDLVHQEVVNLPAWAHGDAAGFFARAEQHERANGRWGTTWQLALPKELSREEQLTLARDFLATHLVDKPYLWVMHDPVNQYGEHQPHIHVLFSERSNDGIERGGPALHFKRYNAAHPERGGCQKDPWFKQRSSVYEMRAAWCDFTNYTLERAGHAARIHPRSLYARGIDRQPEPKVGPSKDPVAMAERERIRQTRDDAKEQALAAAAWDVRKATLGIGDVQQMSPEQFFQESRTRARGHPPGQWAPGAPSARAQRQARAARQQAKLAATTRTLETELRILTRRQQTIHLPRVRRQDTERVRSGLRADLREEEWDHGHRQGYGR